MMLMFQTIGTVMLEFALSVLYFPLWWYSEGLMKVVRLITQQVQSFARSLRLSTLFRFLLQPMYGQRDWWGRVISFGVRIVHFCVLSVFTVVYTVLLVLLLLLWVVLPVGLVYAILFNLELI